MKILHTISSLDAQSGGTSTCTYELLCALNRIHVDVDCLTLCPRVHGTRMLGNDHFIKACHNDAITPLVYSRNFRRELAKSHYDLYHTNGLWLDVNHATCAHARKRGAPYIVSPHGMLYPQALARSAWKKKMMLWLGHYRDLAQAACLHVTCSQEKAYCRKLGFRNPIAVIPNPVDIPPYVQQIPRTDHASFRVGFLGRLHPIKNIENIILAWAKLPLKNAQLVIAGEGEPSYVASLQQLVRDVGAPHVDFIGFVSGIEKYEYLASLDILCAPSHQENFGMSIAEALLIGTPVIASTGTPWEILNTLKCGWWCAGDAHTLAYYLEQALMLSKDERKQMGERGKKLIMTHYASHQIAVMMKSVYRYLIHQNQKPEFVDEY